MNIFSLIILGTISVFSNIAYCEEQAQLNQYKHLATKDVIECAKPEDCDVDGFPTCIDNKCVGK